ncbi:DUF2182 domain-containing protein [Mycobacterium sp.]|uniref:DUF2182 domain-containing protein n=1 Tax=Mycobacterium sp. TaxID=1785 RepID=UPI003F9C6664
MFALAAAGWWWTVDRMRGMDEGPGTDLGTLGWFLGVWIVMMAAMMLPSVSPTVALYSRMTKQRSPVAPAVFVSGYLLTWAGAGLVAFAVSEAGGRVFGDVLSWDRAGRWVAGGTLVAAAAYELTPLKTVCLRHCRSPLGFLLGSWRDGMSGALSMGVKHGAWCLGCCWAFMASLFALGVMSIVWMAFVAGLIAAEKTLPWGRAVTYGTAAILLGLGVLLVAVPDAIPADLAGRNPTQKVRPATRRGCGGLISIQTCSVVVPGLDDHGDDPVKREVDGVRPFREIRRQPDLRWFASALIVDELDPVDDEVHRRYTIHAGRQEQLETDLQFVDAAFGGRVVVRHSRNLICRPPVFFGVDRKTPPPDGGFCLAYGSGCPFG